MEERFISPPLNELPDDNLSKLAGILNNILPSKWEIYVKPFLNGNRPGIILLNPSIGLVVFEVMGVHEDQIKVLSEGDLDEQKQNEFLNELSYNIEKLTYIKKVIHDLYCPRLGAKSGYKNIFGGVVFLNLSQEFLDSKLFPIMQNTLSTPSWRYPNQVFLGNDTISSLELLTEKLQIINLDNKSPLGCDLAKDLRNWLVEPYFSETERFPLHLDEKQNDLVSSRTQTGYRRIKGPAGSGKSLVLASRAAELCASGKKVLVVSFNITLLEYLRRLSSRYIRYNLLRQVSQPILITYLNYHELCKKMIIFNGLIDSYNHIWRELYKEYDEEEFINKRQEILDNDLTNLINGQILDEQTPKDFLYDAILVDEGQDFLPQWWDMLRKLLNENGEMLLCADLTQNIYGTASNWTDESMRGAGFSGDWVRLENSYRLPKEIVEYSTLFAKKYLPSDDLDVPVVADKQLFAECELRWAQVSEEKLERACVDEAINLVAKVKDEKTAITDVTILVPKTEIGLNIVQQIEDKNVRVISIFTHERSEKRSKKMSFTMQEAKVKVTTIHSFKGWESRAIVMLVQECSTDKQKAAFYTGMTRVVNHVRGSFLTVVSSSEDLEEFGKTWPDYKKYP